MKHTLKLLTDVTHSPYSRLEQWKKVTGRKVIGCFPMYVPEEIIHAAGL